MALQNSFPSGGGLTTHAQARRDLEGSVARSAAGVMRAGVLPNHHNQLYTRRNDMRFDIADFRAVQNKAGAGFIANVGVETTPVFAAAPAANKRIDLLYLSQEITPGDPLNEIKFFIAPGTASPSPVAPSLPAASADAIPWMTVEIPAGATSMQSAGVIVKEIFPYTAMAGGTVIVRDLIELGAWAPADGSRAFCIADNAEYVRSGGAWVSVSPPWTTVLDPGPVGSARAQYRKIGSTVEMRGMATKLASTNALFTLPVGLRPASDLHFHDAATPGGSAQSNIKVAPSGSVTHSNSAAAWISLDLVRFAVA